MKSIHTLIPDIYELIKKKDGWFNDDLAKDFAAEVGRRLQEQLGAPQRTPTLRLSKMGPICPRHLWNSIHHPELAEALPPQAEIKFSYGHILEALVICLAKAAGHTVTGEQGHVTVDGISGHRDCIIDGCVVDVKSASSLSFQKFKTGAIKNDDPFGYLEQLDGYLVGSSDDPLVITKDRGYLLAIDKTLGHLVLYEHHVREQHIRQRVAEHKAIVVQADAPRCTCETVPDGKSGNIKLGTKASYSPFKYVCFPKLRTFRYASGPAYLTTVVRKPDVQEVDQHGKAVYN